MKTLYLLLCNTHPKTKWLKAVICSRSCGTAAGTALLFFMECGRGPLIWASVRNHGWAVCPPPSAGWSERLVSGEDSDAGDSHLRGRKMEVVPQRKEREKRRNGAQIRRTSTIRMGHRGRRGWRLGGEEQRHEGPERCEGPTEKCFKKKRSQ